MTQKGSGDLLYYGGPVMHSFTAVPIFWDPAGKLPATYKSTIITWFKDVAHDSGKPSNDFSIAAQYHDTSPGAYHTVYGGSIVDTHAFPSSGCTDAITPNECLTNSQLATEINRLAVANGLTQDLQHEYFIFTPKDIGSCFDSTDTSCAYTQYCAYHTYTGANNTLIYANMPYPTTTLSNPSGTCDEGQSPNGTSQGAADADAVINVSSHEAIESITDPQLNAWYDSSGWEIGDKCAWQFGTTKGASGAQYNEAINNHHYYMQEEYSNLIHDCPQTAPYVALAPATGYKGVATPIKVTVEGFSWSGHVTLKWGTTSLGSFALDSYGNAWVTPLSVVQPTGATYGTYAITATDNAIAAAHGSANYAVTPKITTPSSGADNARASVSGAYFGPSDAVTLKVCTTTTCSTVLSSASTTASSTGTFSSTVCVPSTAAVGSTVYIAARGTVNTADYIARPFAVTSAGTGC